MRVVVCARETEILACTEKMAAVPIPPVYSGHFFYRCARSIRVSLTGSRALVERSDSEVS